MHASFSFQTAVVAIFLLANSLQAQPSPPQGSWTIGNYRLILSQNADEDHWQVLRVSCGSAVVFTTSAVALEVNPEQLLPPRRQLAASQLDTGILGLGVPAVVLFADDGGVQGPFWVQVLTFGREFSALPPISMGGYDLGARFRHVRGRRALAIEAVDPSYVYWESSFVGSPTPSVWLSFDSKLNRYVPDLFLMRAPPPKTEALRCHVTEAREDHAAKLREGLDEVPASLSTTTLQLIYSGNVDAAHEFLIAAWAGSEASREAYWSRIQQALKMRSPYWPVIARLNHLQQK